MASKEFLDIISKMTEVHVKKNADYSEESNPFSNFEFAADLVESFKDPMDQVFVTLIGIKLARINNLLAKNSAPNNETIEDSFIDLANYCVLWGSWYKKLHS